VRIEIGQDALGRWAWMLFDDRNRLIASDDDYREAALAMEAALDQVEREERAAARAAQRVAARA
jgi:hypothetical protein